MPAQTWDYDLIHKIVICRSCNREWPSEKNILPPHDCIPQPPVPLRAARELLACGHNTGYLETIECQSCCGTPGKFKIKIFGCEVYRKVSVESVLPQYRACEGCRQYENKEISDATKEG